jgi:hypothetical protein
MSHFIVRLPKEFWDLIGFLQHKWMKGCLNINCILLLLVRKDMDVNEHAALRLKPC